MWLLRSHKHRLYLNAEPLSLADWLDTQHSDKSLDKSFDRGNERTMTDVREPLVVYTTCHPWIQTVVNEVKPLNFHVEFLDLNDATAVEQTLPRADFIVCLSLTASQVQLLERCQLVMHNGVGYDAIAVDELAERGIPVAVTPAMTPEGVAEHVFMMILALSKQLPAVQSSMRSGEWNMFGWREGSHNVAYKTLGIVGLGRIGKRVAHLGQAFDCRVLYNDIVDPPEEFAKRYQLTAVTTEQLLSESDIVTLHVPLTSETEKMMGSEQFTAMKPGAMFINASRGPTYDLDALYEAIVSGHLLGAGLDVFDPEPAQSDHPIFQLPNVVCTPHIASGTVERQFAINTAQFENCQRVLAGEAPLNQLP